MIRPTFAALLTAVALAGDGPVLPSRADIDDLLRQGQNSLQNYHQARRMNLELLSQGLINEAVAASMESQRHETEAKRSWNRAIESTLRLYGLRPSANGAPIAFGSSQGVRLRWGPVFRPFMSGEFIGTDGERHNVQPGDERDFGITWNDGTIVVGHSAFTSVETLATVLVHEMTHFEDLADTRMSNIIDRELRAHTRALQFHAAKGFAESSAAGNGRALLNRLRKEKRRLLVKRARPIRDAFSKWEASIDSWLHKGARAPGDVMPPLETLEPPETSVAPGRWVRSMEDESRSRFVSSLESQGLIEEQDDGISLPTGESLPMPVSWSATRGAARDPGWEFVKAALALGCSNGPTMGYESKRCGIHVPTTRALEGVQADAAWRPTDCETTLLVEALKGDALDFSLLGNFGKRGDGSEDPRLKTAFDVACRVAKTRLAAVPAPRVHRYRSRRPTPDEVRAKWSNAWRQANTGKFENRREIP